MVYNFNKGEVKKINDFNQEAKNIFKEYTINRINGKYFVTGDNALSIGKHFIISDETSKYSIFNSIMSDNQALTLRSKSVYETISVYKATSISHAEYKDKRLQLCGIKNDESFNIVVGRYVSVVDINDFDNYIKIISNVKESIELDSDDVVALCGNKLMILGENEKYHTRITRQLIPGLKKSHSVSIGFSDNTDNNNLFNMIIINTRNELKSYHIYTCIFM